MILSVLLPIVIGCEVVNAWHPLACEIDIVTVSVAADAKVCVMVRPVPPWPSPKFQLIVSPAGIELSAVNVTGMPGATALPAALLVKLTLNGGGLVTDTEAVVGSPWAEKTTWKVP